MSYCRFSSMNWMCDVYVYEDVYGGWTTHVAARRRAFPPVPDLMTGTARWPRFGGEWSKEQRRVIYPSRLHAFGASIVYGFLAFWHNRIHMGSLRLIPWRRIGLPFDGEHFNDNTPGDCAGRLEALRMMGYRVPQYAIDALRAEQTGDQP
jgi:hypothetical protein